MKMLVECLNEYHETSEVVKVKKEKKKIESNYI